MFNKCIHDWVLVDKTILESTLEQLMKKTLNIEMQRFSNSMGRKTVSIILKCSKCGRLDKTEVSN